MSSRRRRRRIARMLAKNRPITGLPWWLVVAVVLIVVLVTLSRILR